MPEAVNCRYRPIADRAAYKGSLREMRGDELATQIVRRALEQIPQLPQTDNDELILGCAQPAGEQGYGLARVVCRHALVLIRARNHVAALLRNRVCKLSAWAAHADRAERATVFVRRGRRSVSR